MEKLHPPVHRFEFFRAPGECWPCPAKEKCRWGTICHAQALLASNSYHCNRRSRRSLVRSILNQYHLGFTKFVPLDSWERQDWQKTASSKIEGQSCVSHPKSMRLFAEFYQFTIHQWCSACSMTYSNENYGFKLNNIMIRTVQHWEVVPKKVTKFSSSKQCHSMKTLSSCQSHQRGSRRHRNAQPSIIRILIELVGHHRASRSKSPRTNRQKKREFCANHCKEPDNQTTCTSFWHDFTKVNHHQSCSKLTLMKGGKLGKHRHRHRVIFNQCRPPRYSDYHFLETGGSNHEQPWSFSEVGKCPFSSGFYSHHLSWLSLGCDNSNNWVMALLRIFTNPCFFGDD